MRRLLRLESLHQPLLHQSEYWKRLAATFGAAALLIGVSLFAGMLGYHHFEGMPWLDAFATAAMILSGMGPLAPLHTGGGKLFAGLYALYSGLALIFAIGLIFGPVVHRVLHRFHLESDDRDWRTRSVYGPVDRRGPDDRRQTTTHTVERNSPLGKQNYQHEKRQKDIAKKKKAEEKRLRKAADKNGVPPGEAPDHTSDSGAPPQRG